MHDFIYRVENFFLQNCNIFLSFKYIRSKTKRAKQIINLPLLYKVISIRWYRTDKIKKKSDELLYTVRSLVMVRGQLPSG